MNKKRRAEILKAASMLDKAAEILDSCIEGERDYFDNMSEPMKSRERGRSAKDAISRLESARDAIDEDYMILSDFYLDPRRV